uniref:Uncharacterized protein n=1 Tax=Anopheles atroparvus TaxID=41427 RepID=A0AAG5DKF5_ANOAO
MEHRRKPSLMSANAPRRTVRCVREQRSNDNLIVSAMISLSIRCLAAVHHLHNKIMIIIIIIVRNGCRGPWRFLWLLHVLRHLEGPEHTAGLTTEIKYRLRFLSTQVGRRVSNKMKQSQFRGAWPGGRLP